MCVCVCACVYVCVHMRVGLWVHLSHIRVIKKLDQEKMTDWVMKGGNHRGLEELTI